MKVKRRTFLSASAVSLVGALKASAIPLNFLPLQHQWLTSYLEVIGATSVNRLLTTDQELDSQLQANAQSFYSLGYKAFGSTLYYTSKDKVALYPLALHSPSAGIIDLTVLFFRNDASTDYTWKYTHTFSGFELEAIAQAINQLPAQPEEQEAIAMFVPIYELPHQRKPYKFKTASGHIELIVKIEEGKNTMDFKLVRDNSLLVATRFTSRHSLCCNSLA
ncbi:hypothetical protein GCM10027291_50190 [Telluribacter humicola]